MDFAAVEAHLVTMSTWAERCTLAERHVTEGRRTIDRQHALIARKKALGHDTIQSEELLALFERTQEIFEDDLSRLKLAGE